MPGSVTIGHTDALVMLSHDDAKRLSTMLGEMANMLESSGESRSATPRSASSAGAGRRRARS
ncbi:hypothetical protein ACFQ1I_20910 [Kitasatospora arboriphila]